MLWKQGVSDQVDLGQEGKGSVKCFCKSSNEFQVL